MADPAQFQSRTPLSTWLGIVLLFGLFGAIAIAVIGPAPRGDSYEKMRAENRLKKLKDARDEDVKALAGYAWIDKNKGTVRLPIERAMELTVAELASKKPAPAGPIVAPEASAAPGGAAAASPAPSPSASPQSTGTPKPVSVSGPQSESRGQPAAAVNPPAVEPKTQPGASATPAASPQSSAAVAPAPNASVPGSSAPPGSPLPVRGATATPAPQ
jgi:hypothetical protein